MLRCQTTGIEGAGQVDSDNLLPFLIAHLEKLHVAINAGVIDQDVDATQFVDRLGEHGLNIGFDSDIGLGWYGLATRCNDFRHHSFGIRLHDVGHNNGRTFLRQFQGNPLAKTTARAGNNGDLVL